MNDNITIAIISAASAIVGGLSTALIQYLLAKATASREEKRQRQIEFRNRFEDSIVKLIEETDPDIHPVPSISEVTRNIIRLQLYLNLEDADQKELNDYLNGLGASITGYSDSKDKKSILVNHSKVIKLANKVFRKYDA